jgi:hypothetical protein
VRRGWLIALALLTMTSCRQREQAAAVDPGNPLEVAARQANLVVDADSIPPTGLFERRHAGGVDTLCVTPDGRDYRFGVTASFGPTLICEGHGTARQHGETLTLRFSGVDCIAEARYDGGHVRIDGRIPSGCAALCGPRASLSGTGFDRVGNAIADARTARSRRNPAASLCGA